MSSEYMKILSEIYGWTDFSGYGSMQLAVETPGLHSVNMRELRETCDSSSLQLCYNQYLIRWLAGVLPLTQYNWGKATPYNSIDLNLSFNGRGQKSVYKYGSLTAEPSTVLYIAPDYFYVRECYRLFRITQLHEDEIFEKLFELNISEHTNVYSIRTQYNWLREFFLELGKWVNLGSYGLHMQMVGTITETDKQYITDLTTICSENHDVVTFLTKLDELFRISEEII